MKQITINIPDNCELKQESDTYTVVEKEKKLTYEDIVKELFEDRKSYYICSSGIIASAHCIPNSPVNCRSQKQAEKLLAINKLMNVAKYLNGDWNPDWNNYNECKYYICYDNAYSKLRIDCNSSEQNNFVYFKSAELAKQAIEILGEDVIKLALCTDY